MEKKLFFVKLRCNTHEFETYVVAANLDKAEIKAAKLFPYYRISEISFFKLIYV